MRLRARNFYEVIVNKAEVQVNVTITSEKFRANNLIVLVKINLYSLFLQNYLEKRGIKHYFVSEKIGLVALLTATRYLLMNR